MQDLVTVAKLLKPFGVKGEIKAEPLSHDPRRHKSLKRVLLQLVDGSMLEATVLTAASRGGYWYLVFEGYPSPETVRALNGALLQVPLSERVPPPPGQYYPSDLEGLKVIDESGRERGKVMHLLELPSVNTFELVVDGFEVMAPWIDDCIGAIDLGAKTILVKLSYLVDVYPNLAKPAKPSPVRPHAH